MLGELDLIDEHFYYEYSNGEIAIAFFPENQKQHQVIRILSKNKSKALRESYQLLPSFI